MFPLLIAGLILRFAGSTWFTGANTVGDILLWVGGVTTLLWLLVVFGVFGYIFKNA
jgi:hypothetical protein